MSLRGSRVLVWVAGRGPIYWDDHGGGAPASSVTKAPLRLNAEMPFRIVLDKPAFEVGKADNPIKGFVRRDATHPARAYSRLFDILE